MMERFTIRIRVTPIQTFLLFFNVFVSQVISCTCFQLTTTIVCDKANFHIKYFSTNVYEYDFYKMSVYYAIEVKTSTHHIQVQPRRPRQHLQKLLSNKFWRKLCYTYMKMTYNQCSVFSIYKSGRSYKRRALRSGTEGKWVIIRRFKTENVFSAWYSSPLSAGEIVLEFHYSSVCKKLTQP